MNAAIEDGNVASSSERCTTVVIYDDSVTRARALTACDFLVSQMWEKVELDFHWWRTDFLNDANMSRAAAHYAIASDFLIVCSAGFGNVSTTLERWCESWIHERNQTDGALIDLSPNPDASGRATYLQYVLQDVARRGRFDYLAGNASRSTTGTRAEDALPLPPALPIERFPDHSRPSSHFGLNE